MQEEKIYIEGSDDFYITKLGNVYRKTLIDNEYQDILLTVNYNGEYPFWWISFNNTWMPISCHILMAQYFVPNPNNCSVVHHIDNNKFNWKADNLLWVTQRDNVIKAIQDGLTNATELNVVEQICQMLVDGYTNVEISELLRQKKHEISQSTICAIRNKRRWKHISDKFFTEIPAPRSQV